MPDPDHDQLLAELDMLRERCRAAERAQSEAELRHDALFDQLDLGVAVYRAVDDESDFVFLDLNAAGERISRLRREDVVGRRLFEHFPGANELGVRDVLQRVARTGRAERPAPIEVRDEHLHHWVECLVYRLPTGEVVVVYRDVTEEHLAHQQLAELNRELERLVVRRTSELEEANWELEAFAYSVAHELRAPLRAVEGYTRILLEEASHCLDERARGYMLRASSEALRMARLIDDLLKLSRATRAVLHYYDVDLGELARELLESRHRSDPKCNVRASVAAGFIVRGDPVLLREALDELVDNAWKFACGQPEPQIEIAKTSIEGRPTLLVRDNGVGFDAQFVDKAFAPFGRVHGTVEYPGSGIGLTLAQRIVLRHGGRIWIESAPGQGTSVFVTLEVVPRPDTA